MIKRKGLPLDVLLDEKLNEDYLEKLEQPRGIVPKPVNESAGQWLSIEAIAQAYDLTSEQLLSEVVEKGIPARGLYIDDYNPLQETVSTEDGKRKNITKTQWKNLNLEKIGYFVPSLPVQSYLYFLNGFKLLDEIDKMPLNWGFVSIQLNSKIFRDKFDPNKKPPKPRKHPQVELIEQTWQALAKSKPNDRILPKDVFKKIYKEWSALDVDEREDHAVKDMSYDSEHLNRCWIDFGRHKSMTYEGFSNRIGMCAKKFKN